jgi:hypothetical protein
MTIVPAFVINPGSSYQRLLVEAIAEGMVRLTPIINGKTLPAIGVWKRDLWKAVFMKQQEKKYLLCTERAWVVKTISTSFFAKSRLLFVFKTGHWWQRKKSVSLKTKDLEDVLIKIG